MQRFSDISGLSPLQSLFLAGLLLCSSVCAYAYPVILDIDAHSDDGTQIGTRIGLELKKSFPGVEKQYDTYLTSLMTATQFKQLIPQVKALKAVVEPVFQAEVDAIAATWQLNAPDKLGDGKLSITEFWLLQLLPDLTAINKGIAFAVTNRSEHNPIAARNLDWKNAAELKNLQTISLYHYENRTVVTIGFAGLVSVISGFNDQGLFVSLLDASDQQSTNAPLPEATSGFELRNSLKNMNTIGDASQVLAEKTYSRSHQILLVDQEDVAVLEQSAGEKGVLRNTDSPLVNEMPWNNSQQLPVVNCFVLQTSAHNCYSSKDHYRWGRFAQLLKTFPEQDLSVSNVVTLMQDQANIDQALFNEDTLQSIVFTPKDRALYFSTEASMQAAEKYQLIKANSNSELMELAWLVLKIVVLVLVWFSVFRSAFRSHWSKCQRNLNTNFMKVLNFIFGGDKPVQ